MKAFDPSCLKRQTSLAQQPTDWGVIQAEWDTLRSQMIDGDELWRFAHGRGLAFEAGIALKRGEQVVAYVVVLYGAKLFVSWLGVVILSGIVGAFIGFAISSQFFWINTSHGGFLTPMGMTLTLLSGVGLSLCAGAAAIICWRNWWQSQLREME